MEKEKDESEEGPAPKRASRKAAERARARMQRYLEHLAISDPAAPSGPPRSPSPNLLELAEEALRRHTASLQEETSQPANAPARKPASEPASKPAGEPADGAADKAVRMPASQPINQPTPQPTDQLESQPARQQSASQLGNSRPTALVVRWELFLVPIGLGKRWAASAAPQAEPAWPPALTWPRAAELEEVERWLLRSHRLAYYLAPRRDQPERHVEPRVWAVCPDATSPPSSSLQGLRLGRK